MERRAILQPAPGAAPWRAAHTRRLPGVQPLAGTWLTVDAAYGGQMAERERLLAEAPERVLALEPSARPAAEELLGEVLGLLAGMDGFAVGPEAVGCPDGRRVAVDRGAPLATLGRLLQEDLCLLTRSGGGAEHLLAGAVLCFPAGWTLAEKIGRPLGAIHLPVPAYDATVARRVQRLCDGVRAGQPIWRANFHLYETPDLFAPRLEADPPRPKGPEAPYLRVERQTLLRLPSTGAVVFAIHTSVVRVADLDDADRAALGRA